MRALNIDAISCLVSLRYTSRFPTESKEVFVKLSILAFLFQSLYHPRILAHLCHFYKYFDANYFNELSSVNLSVLQNCFYGWNHLLDLTVIFLLLFFRFSHFSLVEESSAALLPCYLHSSKIEIIRRHQS